MGRVKCESVHPNGISYADEFRYWVAGFLHWMLLEGLERMEFLLLFFLVLNIMAMFSYTNRILQKEQGVFAERGRLVVLFYPPFSLLFIFIFV